MISEDRVKELIKHYRKLRTDLKIDYNNPKMAAYEVGRFEVIKNVIDNLEELLK